MTPRQVLEEALSETFRDATGRTGTVQLAPPLDPYEIALFDLEQPAPLPAIIRDLLGFARGFTLLGERVDFLGDSPSEFAPPCPFGIPICTDTFGSFWMAHVHPQTGDWAPILFVSSDPPVVVVQSTDLAAFLGELLSLFRPGRASALDQVYAIALEIWTDNRRLHRVAELRDSNDPALRAFASSLKDDDLLADLRARVIGSGFT
jgi:hypothetical protein